MRYVGVGSPKETCASKFTPAFVCSAFSETSQSCMGRIICFGVAFDGLLLEKELFTLAKVSQL
jgi:hypothetical protein